MFEHRRQPLLHRRAFFRRLTRFAILGVGIVAGSLLIGMAGYHYAEGLDWLDSLLNASMILFGMGPVSELHSTAGKWFASFYALFSGVAFITIIGVVFAPVVHRALHRFHLDLEDKEINRR